MVPWNTKMCGAENGREVARDWLSVTPIFAPMKMFTNIVVPLVGVSRELMVSKIFSKLIF